MNKSIVNPGDFKTLLVEIITSRFVRWVQVQALVSYENRNDAKEFGFGWDREKKIWVVMMPPQEYHKLKNSKSPKKTFEIEVVGYKFHDKSFKTYHELFPPK